MEKLIQRREGREQCEKAQSAECQATMATWEAPPTVMKDMVASFGAHFYRDQFVLRRVIFGLASCQQVRSRSTDRILRYVRKNCRKDGTGGQSKDGDVNSAKIRSDSDCP